MALCSVWNSRTPCFGTAPGLGRHAHHLLESETAELSAGLCLVRFHHFLAAEVLPHPLHRAIEIFVTETDTGQGILLLGVAHTMKGGVVPQEEILIDPVRSRVRVHLYVEALQGVLALPDVHQATREEERGIVEGRGVLIRWRRAVQGVALIAGVVHVLILTRQDPLGVEPDHCTRAGAGVGMTSGTAGLEAVVLHKCAIPRGVAIISY